MLRVRAGLERFDCTTEQGWFGMYVWWTIHGCHDYPSFTWQLRESDKEYLFATTGRRLPKALMLYAQDRPDLQALVDDAELGFEKFILWWLGDGQSEAFVAKTATDLSFYLSSAPHSASSDTLSLPIALQCIWHLRSDLHGFDCTTEQGRFGLYVWWITRDRREYPSFTWQLRESEKEYLFATSGRRLPKALVLYAQDRPDLQALVNDTELGFEKYILWWLGDGQSEAFVAQTAPDLFFYLSSAIHSASSGTLSLPIALQCIWHLRKDLHRFDCTTERGWFGMYVWWTIHGRHDYSSFTWQLRESDKEYLFATTGRRLPKALVLYAQDRPDLQALVDDIELGFEKYILWWLGDGQSEAFVAETAPDLPFYLSSATDSASSDTLPLPIALQCIWILRRDLQDSIDIKTQLGQEKLIAWWQCYGNLEFPLVRFNEIGKREQRHVKRLKSAIKANFSGNDTACNRARGVNVIGFAGGVLGIGEDARMAAAVTRRAGFQVSALKPALLGAPGDSLDFTNNEKVTNNIFPISIFCLPPTEMIRLVLEGNSELLVSEQYKIGAWPWELPTWPENLNGVVNLVDEIWAQSRFVAKSFEALSSVEIHHMPLAVEIPNPTHQVRQKFKLPEKDFLYYIMFDGNSWLSRKNPIGGVKAFQRAFNHGQKGVGLVIKAMNINAQQPMWREITRLAGQDHRIHIISDTLSRQELINLMASCDCCVSLHRSEGFGRVIAEAMLLGQPTVVTNYSGNTDYCTPNTSFLVDGELKPLKAGDYIFPEGQHWCEPDIEHAAEQLRNVLYDSKHREKVANSGKKLIAEKYSVDAVSRLYHERFTRIFEKLDIH